MGIDEPPSSSGSRSADPLGQPGVPIRSGGRPGTSSPSYESAPNAAALLIGLANGVDQRRDPRSLARAASAGPSATRSSGEIASQSQASSPAGLPAHATGSRSRRTTSIPASGAQRRARACRHRGRAPRRRGRRHRRSTGCRWRSRPSRSGGHACPSSAATFRCTDRVGLFPYRVEDARSPDGY
jgi:hypothetical protein